MFGIELQRNNELSLSRQIYITLSNQILTGVLKPNDKLPSTRLLSRDLCVSRNTVYEAYEMLAAEGYIDSRQGSPTRVASGLHLNKQLDETPFPLEKPHPKNYPTDFRTGHPDLKSFPKQTWLQLLHDVSEEISQDLWDYSAPEGLLSLREEIAAWLLRSRGILVKAKNINITSGATHALHLLSDVLLENGGEMVVEDPCHTGMLRTLQRKGYKIRPVPADSQGLQIEGINPYGIRAVYVTPSHQFPLGGILQAARRASLIRLANENDFYIIEDDYDSEFRYTGHPITPLYSMDPKRVIYVGTFSKILFPALRIGYAILPEHLQERFTYLRIHTDVQNPPFEQAALVEFMHTRKLDRHIQKMRRIYGKRRSLLLKELNDRFGSSCISWGDAAGLHLALELPGLCFDDEFTHKSKEKGIRITPVEYHCICKGLHTNKLLLGYGHLDEEEIHRNVQTLHDFINKEYSWR